MCVQITSWIRLSVRILVSALCAAGPLACGASRGLGVIPSEPQASRGIATVPTEGSVPATVTTVLVRNHHGADLRIWVVAEDGTNHRLGIVPKLGSTTMVLPLRGRLPSQLLFVVIPMSSDEPQRSGPVTVEPGAKLVFTVGHDASMSSLSRLP